MTELDRGPYAPPGPAPLADGRCRFVVWAPFVEHVDVVLVRDADAAGAGSGAGSSSTDAGATETRQAPIGDARFREERAVRLERGERGYHAGVLDDVPPGALYLYRLDGEKDRPDPASRHQPYGVHGPSMVVGPLRGPTDDRRRTTDDPAVDTSVRGSASAGHETAGSSSRSHPRSIRDWILYEVHVGTFTERGTFDAAIERLPYLAELGVTALELMPVAQFPGGRNWGYDGVSLYAVQDSYGGPAGLWRLVDACHEHGLAVVLDVVYNHLGPEGNYLGDFGPYFTGVYRTPWGDAINFDGPGSDEVRRFFIANALYWVDTFGIDGLRLDAVHAILDRSAVHFLEELRAAVHGLSSARAGASAAEAEAEGDRDRETEAGGTSGERSRPRPRRPQVIAESDLNDSRLVRRRSEGGYGLDGQWSDDFHHALHAVLTGERQGYYMDFGAVSGLAKAYREGWVFTGERSRFRGRRHGNSPAGVPPWRLVTFAQNHDQVGNRLVGDRLAALVCFERQKLAAAALLLSPFTPLLFMGEEYGETAPFPYFVSHSDPGLVRAVRRGRRSEFRDFDWVGQPPDPQSPETFRSARLDPSLRGRGRHAQLLRLYRDLIALRGLLRSARADSAGSNGTAAREAPRAGPVPQPAVVERSPVIVLRYPDLFVALNFGENPAAAPVPAGAWHKTLDSAASGWGGPGATAPDRLPAEEGTGIELPAWSFSVYGRAGEPSLHTRQPVESVEINEQREAS